MLKNLRPIPARSHGFSLIEVLVTLVVFSVGLLGTAAMQIVSKKATYDAVQRTAAAMVASDLLERMRANPEVLDQYLGVVIGGMQAAPVADCEGAVCAADDLASYDRWSISQAVAGAAESSPNGASGGLADATFCVAGPADGSSGFYEVAIAWRGRTMVPNRSTHGCGAGRYGAQDGYRRLLRFTTFLEAG